MRMAEFAEPIEDTQTITSVSGKRAYDLPAGYIRMKLVTYNGLKLTARQLVTQDFFDVGTTTYPDRYTIWNNQILLGPLPPASPYPIVLYFFREPYVMVNGTDTPEIPNRFRPYLSDYAAAQQMIADGALQDAEVLMNRFDRGCLMLSNWELKRSREDMTVIDTAGYF